MKQFLLLLLVAGTAFSCSKPEYETSTTKELSCSSIHNGNKLYVGREGGCYYFSSSGKKVYVDRSECKNCN